MNKFWMIGDEPIEGGEVLRFGPREKFELEKFVREANPEEITVENMAELMDHDAENCNAHDFVGSHRSLGALLMQEVGSEATIRIFRRMVGFRGLHGMEGVRGVGNWEQTQKELGLMEEAP